MYLTAKSSGCPPSQWLPQAANEWQCYTFDSAVTAFGRIVENALQERENLGSQEKPEYVDKYTIAQILTDGFALKRNPGAWGDPAGNVDGLVRFERIEGFGMDEVN